MQEEVDFRQLIQELRDSGWTYEAIGDHIGRSESTIRNLVRGVADMPRYDVGAKIVNLHRQEYPFG